MSTILNAFEFFPRLWWRTRRSYLRSTWREKFDAAWSAVAEDWKADEVLAEKELDELFNPRARPRLTTQQLEAERRLIWRSSHPLTRLERKCRKLYNRGKRLGMDVTTLSPVL